MLLQVQNDQKKVTTDIYRHGMTFYYELNEFERKGGERDCDTESSVASSFKLGADHLKIGL